MSELKFKAYGELEISEALSDASHVIIEENGDVKRFPANSIGKVKTVNGAEPDESGNVAVEIHAPVQPDFSQNDPTAPDYVKNRPFYTGDPVETVLVEESTVSFVESDGLYAAQFPSTFGVTAGETYTVTWDGTAYKCTYAGGDSLLGNLSIIGEGPDTGEPFIMFVINGEKVQIATADTSASHTISIGVDVESVVKIDLKYLPIASETEPGITSVGYLLQQVEDEYFTLTDFHVSGYNDAATIGKCANKNNSYGIFSPGKFSGAVLSCYNDVVNKYITSVLSGLESIECWKFSQGSTVMEQLWGISKDGVVISSSTPDSTKKFKITVDDSGTLTATEVTA